MIANTDRTLAVTAASLATAGGVAWIALAGDSIVRPDPETYRDALFLLPFVLFAATLACIHHLQRHRTGGLERWGFGVVMVAVAAIAAANLTLVLGSDALQVLSFPLGALAWMLAMVALGVGTVRAGVFPRRVGWAIALAQPVTIATGVALSPIVALQDEGGSYSGVLAHGAVMLVLAAALRDAGRGPSEALQTRGAEGSAAERVTAAAS